METIRARKYDIPVHTFEFPDDGAQVSPEEPDSEEDDHIAVSLYEMRTGPQKLTAIRHVGDERDHYNFRVTDEEFQWCAYDGDADDDIPLDVLHAIHHFGYGVENRVTLGPWFTQWLESQHAIQAIIDTFREADDPFVTSLGQSSAETFDAIVVSLLLKCELSDAEYEAFWEETVSQVLVDGTLRVADLKDRLWERAEQTGTPLLGPGDGSRGELSLGHGVEEYEKPGNNLLAVDVIAPFGVERFAFERQGDNRCVFRREQSFDRPNPMALEALHDHGYEVTNESNIVTADSRIETLGRTLVFLTDIEEHPPVSMDAERHPYNALLRMSKGRIAMLYQLLIAREEDAQSYDTVTSQVLDHLGVQNPRNIPAVELIEVLTAALRLMPDDVHDEVLNRLHKTSAFDKHVEEALDDEFEMPG